MDVFETSRRGAALLKNILTTRLQNFCAFSEREHDALDQLIANERGLAARQDLASMGDAPGKIFIILDGWACRYKELEDGRRQIVAVMLPGDICDLNALVLQEIDHSMGALSDVRFVRAEVDAVDRLMTDFPRIRRALLWHENVTISTQREWTLNLGQRSAIERVAHLLVELFHRLRSVGLTQGDSCEFPITQSDIADTTGLTPVHTNRMLQELRASGAIALAGRRLTVPHLPTLERIAAFEPSYLHLGRKGAPFDAPRMASVN